MFTSGSRAFFPSAWRNNAKLNPPEVTKPMQLIRDGVRLRPHSVVHLISSLSGEDEQRPKTSQIKEMLNYFNSKKNKLYSISVRRHQLRRQSGSSNSLLSMGMSRTTPTHSQSHHKHKFCSSGPTKWFKILDYCWILRLLSHSFTWNTGRQIPPWS